MQYYLQMKKIKNALISVYSKDGIEEIVKKLLKLNINIFSTGGTYEYLKNLGFNIVSVETITSYPSILGGRVKTLHPKIFGGILFKRESENDKIEIDKFEIPEIDLVIVDLYPFEKTLKLTDCIDEIIEKIDIGGISLIRAAAKNYKDVIVIPSSSEYDYLNKLLNKKNGFSDDTDRKYLAVKAFEITSHYDSVILNYFNNENLIKALNINYVNNEVLRYGENPHQQAVFYGDLSECFDQLNGKTISYNNILDLDASISLINDFSEPTIAILKHNNACGLASRAILVDCWKDALASDPVSAYGGIIISNQEIDEETAIEINKLFFEIIIAKSYEKNAIEILKSKKNRIILQNKVSIIPLKQFKTVLNGVIEQERDFLVENSNDLNVVTKKYPTDNEIMDLLFANKIVKHTKSNAIVLVKNKQLIASGMGQTSRVDALKQAISKAKSFGFSLNGAVMASDAFFPFADCVEIAHYEGITSVIQPGGSIRDNESIDFCNANRMSMVFTGNRHFKH